MKNLKYILILLLLCNILSCKKSFLQLNPQGELTPEQLSTQEGVEGLLIGAYGLLNGNVNGTWGNYGAAPSQWLFGEVASDNAHKGSKSADQPNMNAIEQHAPTSTNDNLSNIWDRCFEGIQRCNNTLKFLTTVQAGSGKFTDARAAQIQGEARLLRAHYYFFLKRIFKDVPMITEATTETTVANDKDIYPEITADLQFAVANLTTTKYLGQAGRVDKYIAQAYLGKVLLYQKKYPEAYEQLNTVIFAKPNLVDLPFMDNFNIDRENQPEALFAVQHAVGSDGTGGDNGNVGDMLNNPEALASCCGFFQPSVDLANAYKVDANGLPFLDGSYRNNPYVSDFLVPDNLKETYVLNQTINFDPRIDYTMGRRGVDYRTGHGIMPGNAWIREAESAGPFITLKNVLDKAQIASGTAPGALNISGLNVNLIRLADVYLMAAECAVENGDLGRALVLVNRVRERAAKLTPKTAANNTSAAVYRINQYTAFATADYARNAVRMERRLELAMEGHRFYDLARWGIAKQTLESYFGFEGQYIIYLKGLTIETRDDHFPLPQDQIDRSQGILKQSTGY